MPPPKKKSRCEINYGRRDNVNQDPESKYSSFGCKVTGGFWKEIITYDSAINFGDDDYGKYHMLLDNRVFIHRLFQNGSDHKIDLEIQDKILGYFIYSFSLVSYHGLKPLLINGQKGKNKVKLQKLLEPMKIRLLLLKICDHEMIEKDIKSEDLKDIVSDIKNFNNSKIDGRFEIIEDETRVIKCSIEGDLITSDTVNFCIDFQRIKDYIVNNTDGIIKYNSNNFIFLVLIDYEPFVLDLKDSYEFGMDRDLSVGDIGISVFYNSLFMAELYQDDYGHEKSAIAAATDIVEKLIIEKNILKRPREDQKENMEE
jgi:hypothetical protein